MSQLFKKLGIRQFPSYSNPDYIKHVLQLTKLDVLLHKPKNPKANKAIELLRDLTYSPVEFDFIAQGVVLGIEKNALTKSAIFSDITDNNSALFEDPRHHIAYYLLILEVIVRLMLNDTHFYAHVMDSFSEKARTAAHYRNSVSTMLIGALRLGDPFVGIKIASVEPALWVDRFIRENQSNPAQFSDQHRLKLANRCDRNPEVMRYLSKAGLSLNIAEATMWDSGGELNKLLGTALIARLQGDPIRKQYTDCSPGLSAITSISGFWQALYSHKQENNKVMHLPSIDQSWNDLYIIWNLIFVLRNYPQFGVFFFSKLFIPSVLNATTDFLIARIYAIWVSFFVVENILSSESFFSVVRKDKENILNAWEKQIVPSAIGSSAFSGEELRIASKKLSRVDMTAFREMSRIARGRNFVEKLDSFSDQSVENIFKF